MTSVPVYLQLKEKIHLHEMCRISLNFLFIVSQLVDDLLTCVNQRHIS
jgi:hypothetical protein